jgi:alkaline phosphatase
MYQNHVVRRGVAVAAIAAMLSSTVMPAFAAEAPKVQGPEKVQEWYEAGNRFIWDSKRLHDNTRKAKNVILFVGDGMGVSTIVASRIMQGQLAGKPGEENRLSFENFPNVALSKTYSWDQQTSDSAPTMTAMVTGYKARESMLSVDHTTSRGECSASEIAKRSLPTILELAAKSGRDVGVVSTARITHATPAATYAHTAVRDWEANANISSSCPTTGRVKDIALQLIEPATPAVKSALKVVLGGGRTYFMRNTDAEPESGTTKGRRTDSRDLTAEWKTTRGPGSAYIWNKDQFDAATPYNTRYLLGLFENSHMQYEADRTKKTEGGKYAEPSLTDMTKKAISMLQKNPKGFFLHVEAGRIDHAHHLGNAQRALLDTVELSNAVKQAYLMTNPEETLIVVTADHSHVFTIAGYPHRGNPILGLTRSVPSVDGQPANGVIEPDKDFLGLPYTTLGYQNGPGWRGIAGRPALIESAVSEGAINPDAQPTPGTLTVKNTLALNFFQEAAVPLGAETHAGEDVGIYATGPMAHLVHGSMEQNWIFHVMREAFDFDPKHPWGGYWGN